MNVSVRATQPPLSHSCAALDKVLKLSKYVFTHQDNDNKTHFVRLLWEKELINYGYES